MDWDTYVDSLWATFARDGGLELDPETGKWKRAESE